MDLIQVITPEELYKRKKKEEAVKTVIAFNEIVLEGKNKLLEGKPVFWTKIKISPDVIQKIKEAGYSIENYSYYSEIRINNTREFK